MADIFISYTSSDREWAYWVGHQLESLGHTPRIHDWEISGGGDIAAWMEERHHAADRVLCIVSAAYLEKPLYGAFSVKLFFDALCCFFVWPGRCFFFPACGIPMTPRAGVVEVGRRNEVEARSAFPYPHLDGAEHGVRLRAARGAEDAGVVLRDPARSKAVTALALAQIVSLHLWRRGTNTTTNRGEPALRARDCAATLYSVGPCGAAP